MRIWNRRGKNVPKGAVYLGRPTKYGNPYEIGKDGDRHTVVVKHMVWLKLQLEKDPQFLDELKDVTDGICWCAPKECHLENYNKLLGG